MWVLRIINNTTLDGIVYNFIKLLLIWRIIDNSSKLHFLHSILPTHSSILLVINLIINLRRYSQITHFHFSLIKLTLSLPIQTFISLNTFPQLFIVVWGKGEMMTTAQSDWLNEFLNHSQNCITMSHNVLYFILCIMIIMNWFVR